MNKLNIVRIISKWKNDSLDEVLKWKYEVITFKDSNWNKSELCSITYFTNWYWFNNKLYTNKWELEKAIKELLYKNWFKDSSEKDSNTQLSLDDFNFWKDDSIKVWDIKFPDTEFKDKMSKLNWEGGLIVVPTAEMKSLLVNELLWQFSDGYWENSSNSSWLYLDHNNIIVTTSIEPWVYFRWNIPYKYKWYSVNNSELISYVWDRMKWYLLWGNLLEENKLLLDKTPQLSYDLQIFLEDLVWSDIDTVLEKLKRNINENQGQSKYYQDRYDNLMLFLNQNNNKQKLKDTLNSKISNDVLDTKLRKVLSEITKVLKNPKVY